MNPACPFELVIGLDRSDRKADLYLIHPASAKTEEAEKEFAYVVEVLKGCK